MLCPCGVSWRVKNSDSFVTINLWGWSSGLLQIPFPPGLIKKRATYAKSCEIHGWRDVASTRQESYTNTRGQSKDVSQRYKRIQKIINPPKSLLSLWFVSLIKGYKAHFRGEKLSNWLMRWHTRETKDSKQEQYSKEDHWSDLLPVIWVIFNYPDKSEVIFSQLSG